MNIAICDDLAQERTELRELLAAYMHEHSLRARICEYNSGEAVLEAFAPGMFSLIFLDIYMQGLTGIQTARKLKEADPNCLIVFVTTSPEHGADAFDVDAYHYLIKPLDKAKLFAVLHRWQNLLSEIQTVCLKCGRLNRDIPIREIVYIEVHGRTSTVHTLHETIDTSMTLSSLEAALPPGQFVKPIRYCLAALRYIQSIGETTLRLADNRELNISRLERENLRQQLSAYRLRMLRRR